MSEIHEVNDRRRFILRTLSPVHVGNGGTFKKGIEIRNDLVRGKTHVLDMETVFDLMASENCGSIQTVADIIAFLRGTNIPLDAAAFHVIDIADFPAQEIRVMIRDGAGRPLIPGSSIKGAIRTALVRALLDRESGGKRDLIEDALTRLPPDPKNAAQRLEGRLLRPAGKEPNDDLLRCVAVYDASFSPRKLAVHLVYINSPSPGNPQRRVPFSLAVEAIVPDAEAEIEIALDKFLLHRPELGFNRIKIGWSELEAMMRNHTLNLLNEEIAHYKSLNMSAAVDELGKVLLAMQQAQEGSIPLRLGWGIGWCGTTGELLQSAERHRLLDHYRRQRKGIGKYGSEAYSSEVPFPKSRRITRRGVREGSMETFGWVLLEPAGDRHIPAPLPYKVDITMPSSAPIPENAPIAEKAEPNTTWDDCLLEWDPGGGGILKVSSAQGRAEARQKNAESILNSLPDEARARIKKKRQIKPVSVEVQRLGNIWTIKSVTIKEKA